jgi:ribosomal protein S4E
MPVALLRRAIDFVPYGELVPILFQFTIRVDGREVGELRRPVGVRDRYILRLAGDTEHRIDRRVAVALAIALDALQSR